MQEIELKFQVPAGRVAAVGDAVRRLPAPDDQTNPLPLRAAYLDTPDNRLARQRMALRVRQEGSAWVQTFKGAGADAMTRLEENIAIEPPPGGGTVRANLQRHGGEVQAALARALPAWQPSTDPRGESIGLIPVYETRFERWQGVLPSETGRVLVCLDQGHVIAGPLQTPLCELELELIDGHARAVIEQARHWVQNHGVWLDVQSKAMKGTRLARHAAQGHPEPTQAVAFDTAAPVDGEGSWGPWLSAALDACAGNAAELVRNADGAQRALDAWLQALQAIADHLPCSPWGTNPSARQVAAQAQAWRAELSSLPAEGIQRAQAVAQAPAHTLWALDVLALLYGR